MSNIKPFITRFLLLLYLLIPKFPLIKLFHGTPNLSTLYSYAPQNIATVIIPVLLNIEHHCQSSLWMVGWSRKFPP